MAAVTNCSDFEPKEIKSATVSTVSPCFCHVDDGTGRHDLSFFNVKCNVSIISLPMTSDVEYLLSSVVPICLFYVVFGEILFTLFAHFLIGLFLLSSCRRSYIFWNIFFIRYMIFKYFLPLCGLPYHSVNNVLQIFKFWWNSVYLFFAFDAWLLMFYSRITAVIPVD